MKAWPNVNWPTYLANGRRLCCLIQLNLQNGTTLIFTDNPSDISVSGYGVATSGSGLLRSAVSLSNTLETSNMDAQLNMNPIQKNTQVSPPQDYVVSAINLTNVLAGVYRGAEFLFAFFFPELPGAGVMPYLKGILGETKIGRNSFRISLESQVIQLQLTQPTTVSPTCRNTFGDSKCQVDKGAISLTASVVSVTSANIIVINVALNNPAIVAGSPNVGDLRNAFTYGELLFTSGDNTGTRANIHNISIAGSNTTVTLWITPGFPIAPGDTLTASPGCAKNVPYCLAYQNVINFNGEPDVPGNSIMLNATSLVG